MQLLRTWERWQWRGTPHSPKLQHCWNLNIRLFSVISRTPVGRGFYPSAEKQSVYSTAPADWAISVWRKSLTVTTQECCGQYWTSPGGSTSEFSCFTTTCHPSRTRHGRHSWKSRDKLMSDIMLWTPSHGRAKVERPARTYTQQICADTWCSLEHLPEAMEDREGWREMVREIHNDGVIWWWWWWW